MRPDQVVRLQEVAEKLADLFIDEADPDSWPEADRTERYKHKRDAAETAQLLARAQALLEGPGPGIKPGDPDGVAANERRVSDAEKRAAAAVERALSRAKAGAKASK